MRLVAALLLLLAPLLARAQAPAASGLDASGLDASGPGTQVITAAEIARSGAVRLSDLFELVDGWHTYSVDGYTWSASANGLAPAGEPRWRVYVDGIPIAPVFFERAYLSLLPVHLAQLDSVVVTSVPDASSGSFAPAGALHLFTRRPEEGVGVRGAVSAENEVGDPGPFRYTPHAAPNIDRSGPLFLAEGAARRGAWHVRAGLKDDEFHATDERIIRRVQHRFDDVRQPYLRLGATMLQAGMDHPAHRHRLLAGYTRLDDLLFWEPLGSEVPVRHRMTFAGLQGATGATDGIAYRASFTRQEAGWRPNRDSIDLAFSQNRLDLNLELRRGGPRFHGALGAGVDYTTTTTAVPLRDPSLIVTRAYGRLRLAPGRSWQAGLDVHLQHAYDRIGTSALLHARLRPARRHSVALRVSLDRRPIEAQNSLWYWTTLGYRLPDRTGGTLPALPYLPLSTTATADAGWQAQAAAGLSFEVGASYRRFFEHVVPVFSLAHDSLSDGFAATTQLTTGVSGRTAGMRAGIRHVASAQLRHRVFYQYTRPVWSNAAFWAAWSAQPWHQASYSVTFAPVARFSLDARLRYRSASLWPSYAQAAFETGGRVPDRLPAFWLLDVTARKLLWRDHVQVRLSLHNLLNEPYRTHPAGVVTNLSFSFGLTASLGPALAAD